MNLQSIPIGHIKLDQKFVSQLQREREGNLTSVDDMYMMAIKRSALPFM
jgi:hypothetical protein